MTNSTIPTLTDYQLSSLIDYARVLFELSAPHYKVNESFRHYHNYGHSQDVYHSNVHLINMDPVLADNKLQRCASGLAASWHDAVYFPGAEPGINEKASAFALRVCHKEWVNKFHANTPAKDVQEHSEVLKALEHLVDSAALLIEKTTVDWHLYTERLTGFHACLLDADLFNLGLPYEIFRLKQELIILESKCMPQINAPYDQNITDEDRAKVAKFLQKLLTVRSHIYHSERARSFMEDSARNNITEYCKEYLGS